MIAKAMEITGLKSRISTVSSDKATKGSDAKDTSSWAQNSIAERLQAGVVTGRRSKKLTPKASITRAEVAVITQRLLKKSDLT